MKYRVVSLERRSVLSDTLKVVLEDDTPEGNWTDIQCAGDSPFGKTMIAAHTSGHTIRVEIGEQEKT